MTKEDLSYINDTMVRNYAAYDTELLLACKNQLSSLIKKSYWYPHLNVPSLLCIVQFIISGSVTGKWYINEFNVIFFIICNLASVSAYWRAVFYSSGLIQRSNCGSMVFMYAEPKEFTTLLLPFFAGANGEFDYEIIEMIIWPYALVKEIVMHRRIVAILKRRNVMPAGIKRARHEIDLINEQLALRGKL